MKAAVDLLERVWGERPNQRESSSGGSTNTRQAAGLLTMERNGERAVGLASLSFLRCRVAGEEQLVAMPLQVATDPAERGKGIFGRLERANEEEAAARGCELGVTFPNDASRPIFLERLGWRELWRGRIWVRPPAVPSRRGQLRIESLTRVPTEVERLGATANGQLVDAAFLEWRYLRLAARVPDPGRVPRRRAGGAARVAAEPRPGRDRLPRARRGRATAARDRLGEADDRARPARAAWRFLAAGFVPTPKPIRVLAKKLRPEGNLDGPWQFQLGDFDLF